MSLLLFLKHPRVPAPRIKPADEKVEQRPEFVEGRARILFRIGFDTDVRWAVRETVGVEARTSWTATVRLEAARATATWMVRRTIRPAATRSRWAARLRLRIAAPTGWYATRRGLGDVDETIVRLLADRQQTEDELIALLG